MIYSIWTKNIPESLKWSRLILVSPYVQLSQEMGQLGIIQGFFAHSPLSAQNLHFLFLSSRVSAIILEISTELKSITLPAFMGSYAYWWEANELTCHFKLYSDKPLQRIKQRNPFGNAHKAGNGYQRWPLVPNFVAK